MLVEVRCYADRVTNAPHKFGSTCNALLFQIEDDSIGETRIRCWRCHTDLTFIWDREPAMAST